MNKPDLSKIGAVTAGKTRTTGISPFSELELSKVYPNPDQPRKQFNDIEQLAATILEHGLLQPITVVKKDDRYMIIAGERRYKAHLHNEAKTIKAYIVDVSEEQVEELTLIENIQRNDLTDFEIAKHICKLWDSGRYEKKSDLAKKLGKSDTYISKAFSSLKLDSEILEDIEVNKKDISVSVMDEIARVKDPTVQKEVYQKYSAGEITRDDIKEFKPKKKIKDFSEASYNDGTNIPYKEQEVTDEDWKVLDNDLVEQAKSFTENFPRENVDNISNEKIENIQGNRTIINRIVGVGKSILSPTNEQTYLPIEDIGGFYLYNTGAGATKMFKKDVSYRLTIEEFDPIFQKFDALDIVNKENEELTTKIKELKEEIEELKLENTKEVITQDEIKFTKVDNVKIIISNMEDYIKTHNAYLDGSWIKDASGALETHLDNDYEIELFKLLMEKYKLKKV